MKPTSKPALALALAALAFAASAVAEEVFVHFEDMSVGASVAGLGTVYQDLDIQALNSPGDPLRVIQTFLNDPPLIVYRAPNTNPWWQDEDLAINDSLEDEHGDIVCAHGGAYGGEIAQGFANTACSWLGWNDDYWCPQEFRISFNYRRAYKFKMLMVDYGDWNPAYAVDHGVYLRGFDNGVEVAVPHTIEYTTNPVAAPPWCSLGFDPRVEADACLCDGSGLGHTHLTIHAPPDSNGFDAVELWMSDPGVFVPEPDCATNLPDDPIGCDLCATAGCDPNTAFDSLLIGYVNLFDVHPVSCPNPLNLGGKGVLPSAVLGTMDFDVSMVMPETCALEGVPPKKWSYEDVSRPYVAELINQNSCTSEGPDGFMDLTLKFKNAEVAAAVGAPPGSIVTVTLECTLTDGTVLTSEDIMKVVG